MSSTRIEADRLIDWVDQAILYLNVYAWEAESTSQPDPEASESGEVPLVVEAETEASESGEVPLVVEAETEAFDSAEQQPTKKLSLRERFGRRIAGGDLVPFRFERSPGRNRINHLRRVGIRTASDLQQAYEAAVKRDEDRAAENGDDGESCQVDRASEVDRLLETLDLPGSTQSGRGISRVRLWLDTLPDEEWFSQIRRWRMSPLARPSAPLWFLNGKSFLPVRMRLPSEEQLDRGESESWEVDAKATSDGLAHDMSGGIETMPEVAAPTSFGRCQWLRHKLARYHAAWGDS